MRFHWQNLNEDRFGRKGSGFKHGRCWWHIGEAGTRHPVFHTEWCFGKNHCHIGMNFGGEENDLSLSLAIPGIYLYFQLDGALPYKTKEKLFTMYGREIRVAIFDWGIWFDIWRKDNGWYKGGFDWHHFNFNLRDFILGNTKYSKVILEQRDVEVPMPEGSYPAKVVLEECFWKRPRWFAKKILRADIEMIDKPIPIPGKGENSWDCGDDAVYSMTMPAKSITEGIGKLVTSCLDTRLKRSGSMKWDKGKVAV